MCSIAESMLGSCPSPGANIPVMTFSPESAAKVRGRRNSWAARVITTCTRIPRSCSRRTISPALYAAIPPVTPRAIFMDSGLLIHGVEPRLPQSTISDHEIKNSVSPGQAPYPAPLPLARRRSGFPESPTSPCPHGFHPAQCGTACESLCRPLAVPPTAVAALVVLPPGCIGSCCQSLRSTSWDSPSHQVRLNVCRTSNNAFHRTQPTFRLLLLYLLTACDAPFPASLK